MNPLWIKAGLNAAKSKTGRKVIAVILALGVLTSPFALIIAAGVISISAFGSDETASGGMPVACTATLPGTALSGPSSLSQKQMQNAATIIAVGRQLNVPPRGWAVAIATARQESGLLSLASLAEMDSLNYPHDGTAAGDHDSVGIFQQRDAWGPTAARMDVATSAKMFYTGGNAGQRGLLDVPGWQTMSIAEAAQSVQASAFPSAYAQWEALATATVASLGNVDLSASCGNIATGPWTLPIAGAYTLTAGFGECSSLWSHCHTGQDFAVPTGTPVHACSAGVVKFVGWNDAYGNLTEIQHADGVETWYAHQSSQSVKVGDPVNPGDVIGLSGATGNVTGPHLHLEVRINDRPIDPLPFLRERGLKP